MESHSIAEESNRPTLKGCLVTLAGTLDRIPFLVAYLVSNIFVAIAIMVAIWIARRVYKLLIYNKTSPQYPRSFRLAVLSLVIANVCLAFASLWFSDPFYFQLVPSLILLALIGWHLGSIYFGLPHDFVSEFWPAFPHARQKFWISTGYCVWAVVLALVNLALIYLASLNVWVVFFTFARWEFIAAIVITTIGARFAR